MLRFPTVGVLAFTSSMFLACSQTNVTHDPGAGTGTGGVGNGGSTGGGAGSTGGGAGSTGGGAGNTGSDDGGNCGVLNFTLTKGGTPDLLIVEDLSTSMLDSEDDKTPTSTNPSKWSQISAGLQSVVGSVTGVNWGMLYFPSPKPVNIFQCVNSTPDVPIDSTKSQSQTIITSLQNTTPSGGTPTTAALQAATTYLQGLNDGNAHYIVLATDGQPNACSGSADDSAAAEAAVTAAAKAGINTFVLGIGTAKTAQDTLNAMAMNGGEAMTGGTTSYYPVKNTSDLTTHLGTIATGLISCTYPLQMAPANPDLVEIDGNGMKIPRDKTHMNGWDFGPNNMSIIFYGTACENLQKGVTTKVEAVYGCGAIT